ncbi:hypothetical protein [Novosphingobium lentum]|uniref:hypothetical protein n=1 Tax=Novosphingobium lentum TaxID=145287 RepID=UPI000AE44EAB|nr:hypothetical protein [Novosphingobium lentum]
MARAALLPVMRPRRWALLGCVGLLCLSGAVVAQRGPESLLPPGFDSAPAPTPAPKAAPNRAAAAEPAPVGATSTPVIQAIPKGASGPVAPRAPSVGPLAAGEGDIADTIDPDLLQQLIDSTKPKYDIPPASQRSLAEVGVIAEQDGGMASASTAMLSGDYIAKIIIGTKGPLVSRWGQILLRRALSSRLATPVGMNGADWAAIRAQTLLNIGEADAARMMVQEVDSGDYTPSLEDAAMGSFLATADPVGMCPITALTAAERDGPQWDMIRAICSAFTSDGPPAMSQLDRTMRHGAADKVDVLLAQKFAGAASTTRRAVKIEWTTVDNLTPWRYGMALATGLEPPADLMAKAGAPYYLLAARAPMLPLASRAAAADFAAARGVLSSAAMVDLYSQLYAQDDQGDEWAGRATKLRDAYTAASPDDRIKAIKSLWGDDSDPARTYSRRVLTAYAAARVLPSDAASADADALIASMLTAGLDRNALLWAPHVSLGSHAWGLLSLAAPSRTPVASDGLNAFYQDDNSKDALRSGFLLAGLMGLDRVSGSDASSYAGKLKIDMSRQTRWTHAIDEAAQSNNPALVAFLAGFGMQGSGWDKMTPVYLLHIVGALHKVGLDGEARMIAAEAIARV